MRGKRTRWRPAYLAAAALCLALVYPLASAVLSQTTPNVEQGR